MKRQLPSTSHEANRKATQEMRDQHHAKIINALTKLGTSNYEAIGDYVGLDKHQVGRRLCELERSLLIYKPGTQSPTKSGRMAMDYCLTGSGMPKTTNEANLYKPGTKTSTDFSKELIQNTQRSLF